MIWDEMSRMPFGKHKDEFIKFIDRVYLEKLVKSWPTEQDASLRVFLEKYLGVYVASDIQEMVSFICEKKTYATEKIAKDALRRITYAGEKLPIRAYECPKCSGWHLTSIPIQQFKKYAK